MSNLKKATFKPIIFDVMQFDGTLKSAQEIYDWIYKTLEGKSSPWHLEYNEGSNKGSLKIQDDILSLTIDEEDWVVFNDGNFVVYDNGMFNQLFHISEGE